MYTITFHPDANKEFEKLDSGQRIEAAKKLEKLAKNPLLGKSLGNKFGLDLTNYRSIRFCNGKKRIIYIIKNKVIEVHILAIGNRESEKAYSNAFRRLS